MAPPERSIILMGVPEAGKTTFLGALWYVLKHAPTTDLHVTALPGDQQYLNLISGRWLRGQPQEHTNQGARVELSLAVGTDADVVLCLPDASGEVYQRQWAGRRWTADYDVLARCSSGVVVFVHPNHASQGALLADVATGAEILGPGGVSGNSSAVGEETPWNPDRVPAETVLIECLQFLLGAPCHREFLKVALVISAWDLVQSLRKSPRQWFESEFPLLAQFCTTNSSRLSLRCFGISAQGGKLEDEESASALLAIPDPVTRIIALDGDGRPVGIVAPVLWLLNALSQAG